MAVAASTATAATTVKAAATATAKTVARATAAAAVTATETVSVTATAISTKTVRQIVAVKASVTAVCKKKVGMAQGRAVEAGEEAKTKERGEVNINYEITVKLPRPRF